MPEQSTSSGDNHRWATVIAVGAGKWAKDKYGKDLGRRIPVDIKVGNRVLVVRWLKEVHTNKALSEKLPEGMMFVKQSDILCVEEDG